MSKRTVGELEKVVNTQRELLIRAQRWIGVAAGAMAAAHTAACQRDHFSYPLRDSSTDALALAADISAYLLGRTP